MRIQILISWRVCFQPKRSKRFKSKEALKSKSLTVLLHTLEAGSSMAHRNHPKHHTAWKRSWSPKVPSLTQQIIEVWTIIENMALSPLLLHCFLCKSGCLLSQPKLSRVPQEVYRIYSYQQSTGSLSNGAEETRHVCCGSGLIGVSPFLSFDFRLCKTCTRQTSWKSSTSIFLILLLFSFDLLDAGLYQLLLFTLKHHSDHEAPSTQWVDRGSPILGWPHSKMLCLNLSFGRWKYQDKP